MIRCAGGVYVIVQVVIWHSFYTAAPRRLLAPALAVAWAVAAAAYLRKRSPSAPLACLDSAVYVVLALGAQACVPPAVRGNAFSWLVISMSGQLIVSAWYAPVVLSLLLTLSSPLAYWAGAAAQPGMPVRAVTAAVTLLLVVGIVHVSGRLVLYGSAAAADADVHRADEAAREQYAVLCRNIERREHERLLHDTVLNTLTAVARADGDAGAKAARCRQDVALIEAALGGADDLAADSARPSGDLLRALRAVAAGLRDRGLTVHLEADGMSDAAVPARVITAISNAVREALSNVAAHAGTGEAWVCVRRAAAEGNAGGPCRLRVSVRDRGTGFDPDGVDRARLGLRRSIRERIAECGGQASVRSAPGQGTEVCLSWPASEPSGAPGLAGDALAGRGYAVADGGLAAENPPW